MKVPQRYKQVFQGIRKHKPGRIATKGVLLYLLFVAISAVFWCFITFNVDVQQEIEVNFEIVNKPSNVTYITEPPKTITMTVRDKGSWFVRYWITTQSLIKVDFKKYSNDNSGLITLTSRQLIDEIRKTVGRNITVLSVFPENVSVKYTDLEGKKVPIRFDLDIEANLKYAIGKYEASADSVLVYADNETLSQISEVYTYHTQMVNLTDTLRRSVTIQPCVGAKIVPSSVKIMVPVERLIQKHQQVSIQVRNVPDKQSLIVFPSSVEVSYLVPQSQYKNTISSISVVADYYSIDWASKSGKVAVFVADYPPVCRNVELAVDSVDFIVEKH